MKYESELVKRKARAPKICHHCGTSVLVGESYFSEEPKDKFLNVIRKYYCTKCGSNRMKHE